MGAGCIFMVKLPRNEANRLSKAEQKASKFTGLIPKP